MASRRSRETFPFTPIPQANELLRTSGTALLIGLCLEQQVRSEKAMSGPYVLQQRLGHLDAKKIAALPPATLDEVFRRPPALHRFPGMMAKRVRALCAVIGRDYSNDGTRVWLGANTAEEAYGRFCSLPGFGDYKAASAVRILGAYAKLKLPGWQRYSCDEDLPWEFLAGEKLTRNKRA